MISSLFTKDNLDTWYEEGRKR